MNVGDKISVVCLDNGKVMPAVLHKMNKEYVTVVLNAGAVTLTLMRKGNRYIGTKSGLEFCVDLNNK